MTAKTLREDKSRAAPSGGESAETSTVTPRAGGAPLPSVGLAASSTVPTGATPVGPVDSASAGAGLAGAGNPPPTGAGLAGASSALAGAPTVPVGAGSATPSPGQATEAIPVVSVETSEYRQRGLTPVSLLLTAFAGYFLYKVQIVLVLLVVGILLATAITGPVDLLTRRLHIKKGQAILITYLAILAGLAVFFYLIIPPVAREGARFVRDVPGLFNTWRGQAAASDNPVIRNVAGRVFEAINGQTQGGALPVPTDLAVGLVSGIGGGLITLFTLFLIAFYWITEKPLIKRAMVGLFAPGQHQRVLRIWGEVEAKLGAWLRGQLTLMVIIGVLATMAYGVMGLPFWLILGVIAGLTEAIPNVGPILGAAPAVLIALTVDWKLALAVVLFVTVLQLLENAVLVPRVMKGALGLTPLTVILAILAGSEFRGVVGALLAVPLVGAVSVILGDMLNEKRQREADERQERPGEWLRQAWRRGRARRAEVGAGEGGRES